MLLLNEQKFLAWLGRAKSQRIFILSLFIVFIFGAFFLASPFLFEGQITKAAAPITGHWSINKIAGAAGATTTVYAMAFAGDDLSTPGGSPALTVAAFYQNSGWSGWGETDCVSQDSNSNLFKCALNVSAGADLRTFKYYLRAFDATSYFFQSWNASVTNSTSSAQTAPMEATVFNSPSWNNTISGQYSASLAWAGVKDGRCTALSAAVASGTSTIYANEIIARNNGFAMTPLQWISLENEKFQITATSSSGADLKIILGGNTSSSHSLSACAFQYLSGATVWVQGTTISATTSNVATTDFGTFILRNVPDGSYDLVAFKNGFMDGKLIGLTTNGGVTSTVQVMVPYGTFGGGGIVEGVRVVWSAPSEGMMGAPSDIGITAMPIMLGLSENASSTTITTSTVQLKKINADQTTSLVSGYSVAYEPMNSTVTIGATTYDFGNEPKIIIYSSTKLATSTSYIVRVTSDVKNSNGQSITGNDPLGGHSIMFSISGGFFSGGISSGQFAQGGATMPPFIMGMAPRQGEMNVSRNTKAILLFNQPLNSSTFTSNVELWRLDASFNKAAQISINASSTVTNQKIIVVTPLSDLAASTRYRLIVKGGIQASSGITMSPPDQTSNEMFQFEFTTGTSTDTTVPTVLATSLGRYVNSSGSYVSVPINEPIKIAFSKPLDPTTITASTVTLKVKGSSSNLTATAEYDLNEGKAILIAGSALNATSTYVLTLSGDIKDLTTAANALSATSSEFTTGGTDIVSPTLQFMNADDYNVALTFSEAMNTATITNTNTWPSGSSKWATSVLNPKNYRIYVDNGQSGATAKYFSYDSLASSTDFTFNYDSLNNTAKISGLKLFADPSGVRNGVRVWIDNVTDISGNVIADSGTKTPPSEFGQNSRGGPVQSSATTFGMVGPSSGMMGPPSSASTFTSTDFGGKNPAMMGMSPVGVWPMNKVASAYSVYMIDIPISAGNALSAGGKVVLGPFPAESDVSGAKNADKAGSFAHYDINGPGTGKVVIDTTTAEASGGVADDGVTVAGQIVTVTLGSVGTGAPDFIHLELDGIKNPSTPTEGGYKIAIQTQTSGATGRQLESFTSMPFFIMPKGKYTLIGRVRSGGTALNTVNLYGGSPATGPLQTASINNGFGSSTDGEFKIEGLSAGQVMISPEPFIQVGATEYVSPMPQPIFLDDATTAGNTGAAVASVTGCTALTCYYYKDFNLTTVSAANTPALTVKIYGNFALLGSTNLDIFAGGPSGYRVKTVTLNTDCSVTPSTQTLNLPTIGNFNVGIGPAMPKGPMGMAGPAMPTSWMPPKNESVSVAGSGGTWVWVENSATPNDGTVQFIIQVADKTILGQVLDPAGNAVSNAQVFAYSSSEQFGTGAQTNSTGNFILNVKQGSYKVGAFLPGAPPSNEIAVEVKLSGAVYADGVLTTLLTLKLSKNIQTGYTISGYVYSDTNSNYPASNASVYGYRTDGPGHSETMTDSKGSYTLYVGIGTWKVGVYLPDYGNLTEQTVVIAASKSGLNFTPSGSIVTIRERVWQDANNNDSYDAGEGVANVMVSVVSTSTDYVNNVSTDANGIYEAKVPASTTYDIQAWSSDIGSLPPVKNVIVTTTDIIYTSFSGLADVATEHATTVEFTFYDFNGNATTADKVLIQLDQTGVAGVSNDIYKENVATTTIRVATSTTPYLMDIEIQGISKALLTITPFDTGSAVGTSTVDAVLFATTSVNGYEKIKIILPVVSFISGQVKDGDGIAVPNAVLHIEQPGKDIEFDVEADSSGNYSFRVASSSSPYLIQADKTGYVDSAISVYTTSSAVLFNPIVEATAYSISGTIIVNNSTPGADCYVFAEKLGGGYVSTSGNCDSTTGVYTVKVINGDWEISAVVESYNKSTKSTIVNIASSNQTGVNIHITSSKTLDNEQAQGMTGTSGGTFTNSDAGFSMNIPQSTISASDSSTYNVKEKEISAVPTYTPTCNLVGDKAEEVSAYKNSGSNSSASTVSGLNGAAFVDKIFTLAELVAEGIDTVVEVEQTKMGTYDDTAQNWTNVPTTITYLNSSEQPVVPVSNLSNVSTVVFNGVTQHFSTFGVTNTAFDGLAPSAPTGVTVVKSGAKAFQISWTAATTNIDGTTASDILYYNIWRATSDASSAVWTKIDAVSFSESSYIDTTISYGTDYYYRVTADSGLQSQFSTVTTGLGVSLAGSVSGGGGGGGDSSVIEQTNATSTATTTVATATTTTTVGTTTGVPSTVSQQIYSGVPSDFRFKISLKYIMNNSDIKLLQIILNADSETKVAETGPGSPGNETNMFGALTKAAVIKFQEKYKAEILTPLGLTSGTGLVGSATIAKLNQLLSQSLSLIQVPLASPSQVYAGIPVDFKFKFALKYKMVGSDIKLLQIILNADSETKVAETGPGSPGNETNMFGDLTKAAILKFQEKYKAEILTPLGLSSATGFVGSATIVKLNKLLGR